MEPSLPPPRRRIFLISFNKCGTGSFYHLFRRCGIPSAHHGGNDPATNLALHMFKNFMLARDPLTNIDEFVAYTDLAYFTDGMFYEAARLYPYLHRHYRDSYFILATRLTEDWVRSRLAHGGGSIVPRALSALEISSTSELVDLWQTQFDTHNQEVRAYFGRRSRARFLEFDLLGDDPRSIAEFLQDDYDIDLSHWKQRNVTSDETRERAMERLAQIDPERPV